MTASTVRAVVPQPSPAAIAIRAPMSQRNTSHASNSAQPNSLPIATEQRPRTRGECPASRPCPWVGCRYHLYLDVHEPSGRLMFNFPELEPWELAETCALDVAEWAARIDGLTLAEVSELMSISREWVRHLESRALELLRLQRRQLK